MSFDAEPQGWLDRSIIRRGMIRVHRALKEDDQANVLHALAIMQNLIGHLIATQLTSEQERQHHTQLAITNIPLYVQAYKEGERKLP